MGQHRGSSTAGELLDTSRCARSRAYWSNGATDDVLAAGRSPDRHVVIVGAETRPAGGVDPVRASVPPFEAPRAMFGYRAPQTLERRRSRTPSRARRWAYLLARGRPGRCGTGAQVSAALVPG